MSDQSDRQGEEVQAAEGVEAPNDSFTEEAAEVAAENEQVEQSAEDLASLLSEAQQKADEHKDQLMRVHAEMENLKRRHTQEIEKAHKFAVDKFVGEILGVWDSLELGNAAAQDPAADVDKIREGTELTLKMLVDGMNKLGVEQINPEGEAFNPEFHQAMSMVPNGDVPPNTVLTVIQKGYTLNGRLVRPAMVMVSAAGAPPSVDESA